MRLTQITLSCPDLDEGWRFYCALGFTPIVDSRPHYARFVFPDGEATLSLDHDETGAHGGVEIGIECEDLDAVHGRRSISGGCGAKRGSRIPAATPSSSSSPAKTGSIRRGSLRPEADGRRSERAPGYRVHGTFACLGAGSDVTLDASQREYR
jgi:catechol 2,3-dioxygenase-like lactoylglutathione lyase family enzyme